MALTDTAVKNVKSSGKTLKMFDGGGLFLEVPPTGSKRWRLKYRFHNKEKLISLGTYPTVKLKDAREQRDENRKLLIRGVDPSVHRQNMKAAGVERAGNSFELIAREWHVRFNSSWEENHAERILRSLEKDLFPWLGSKPIAELTPVEILKCIQRIEKRGALETAHRALQRCGQILRFAVATSRASRDVTVDLRGALPPVQGKHLPAITDPQKAGELLRTV